MAGNKPFQCTSRFRAHWVNNRGSTMGQHIPLSEARRRFLSLLAVFALLAGLVPGQPVYAGDPAEEAESFIQGMADDAIVNLTATDITRDERKNRMRELMDEYFFVPGIAQWVLGRFWRQASKEEREEYVLLFEDLLVETYVDRFATYSGETLEIVKTDVRNAKDVIVTSTLVRPTSTEPIEVEWRVRAHDDVYKIIDIMVEGVSMGQTQRAEFASAIKNNGGDISKFLAELRERIVVAGSGA